MDLGAVLKSRIGGKEPCNRSAIPVVNQVMSATRGATDAFSGVTAHVNNALKKVGAKNIEAGIGCGVGFGHGFGVGLALKPGVMNQIQSSFIQLMTKMMSKFGMGPNLPIGPGALPGSLQGGMSMISGPLSQSPMGNMMQLGTKSLDNTSQTLPGYGNMGFSSYQSIASSSSPDLSVESRTEKVLSSFLQNPVLKQEDDTKLNDLVGSLRSENNMLQMVLKHQRIIEELQEENEKLRQILIEDLKVSPSKIDTSYWSKRWSPCTDCFECRRKQRRK
ncbi:uncharacterized protein LOC116209277 isoform X2 [Punica granatum]|uniref:Uncharacterized protein LOC116209277 isoform X2 n=1 Tax=Punica granatum TaxID=22663 RepID=A0A6P8DWJ7_PUNGR|nr:uncharacterized protein LOC116209277 isoform X2 [Punica granatum]